MADEAFTSDGEPRPNMAMALAAAGFVMPDPIPTDIGLSARVVVLSTIAQAVNAGGGSIAVLDPAASYDNSSVVRRINDISTAINTAGASPPLPIYTSLDYNAF